MEIDVATVVIAFAGVAVAAAFAVFAGTVSARVFFDATQNPEGDDPAIR